MSTPKPPRRYRVRSAAIVAGVLVLAAAVAPAVQSAKRKAPRAHISAGQPGPDRNHNAKHPFGDAPRRSVPVDARKDDGRACRTAVRASEEHRAGRSNAREYEAAMNRAKAEASNERMVALIDEIGRGANPWCPSGPPPAPVPGWAP